MTTSGLEQWPKKITLVVFDFDGVMTDNRVYVSANGEETVRCNRSDGLGVAAMRKADVHMLVLSTEKHPVVAARCKKLQLACYQDISNKAAFLTVYCDKENIDLAEVAYIGNDTNDLECLRLVGLPVVVADAHPDVMDAARVVLTKEGGQGAIREFCDQFLKRYA